MSDFRLSPASAQPSIHVLDAVKQQDGFAYPPAFGSPGLLRPTDARSRHALDMVWLALRYYYENPNSSTLLRFEYHRLAHNFLVTQRYHCFAYSELLPLPASWGKPSERKPLYMLNVNPVDLSVCARELDDGADIITGNINCDKLVFLHEHLAWLHAARVWTSHPADQADIDTAIVHLLRKQMQIIGHKREAA